LTPDDEFNACAKQFTPAPLVAKENCAARQPTLCGNNIKYGTAPSLAIPPPAPAPDVPPPAPFVLPPAPPVNPPPVVAPPPPGKSRLFIKFAAIVGLSQCLRGPHKGQRSNFARLVWTS
jgi:hypothetical protein